MCDVNRPLASSYDWLLNGIFSSVFTIHVKEVIEIKVKSPIFDALNIKPPNHCGNMNTLSENRSII